MQHEGEPLGRSQRVEDHKQRGTDRIDVTGNDGEHSMSEGINAIIYPVRDLAKVKVLYSELLGVKPSTDEAYYAGCKVEDLDVGLDPHGHSRE